jgi:hypothetical protein
MLKVKSNWQVFQSDSRGIDFLGYRIFHEFCLLRKSIVNSFKKKMKQINNRVGEKNILSSIMSYVGWMEHANTKKLMYKYISEALV